MGDSNWNLLNTQLEKMTHNESKSLVLLEIQRSRERESERINGITKNNTYYFGDTKHQTDIDDNDTKKLNTNKKGFELEHPTSPTHNQALFSLRRNKKPTT